MWGVCLVINVIFSLILVREIVHQYQLNSYRIKFNFITTMEVIKVLLAGAVSIFIQQLIVYLAPNPLDVLGYCVSMLPIVGMIAINLLAKKKIPLVFTNRVRRQYLVIFILSALVFGICGYLSKEMTGKEIILLSSGYLFMPLVFLLSIAIVMPIEKFVQGKFVKLAKNRLINNTNLIKIGITGSYAKTSVKNILASMLSAKYKVVATPHSYNTPMGIAKSTEMIGENTQVFIAEMGARRQGDIKELAEIVCPSIAVITGIAPQHLESFKSIENIINTKHELVASLPSKGVVFYNGDSKYINSMYYKSSIANKHISGLNSGYVHAENIMSSANGSNFTLCIGKRKTECQTKLLGKHNLSNIILSATVASHLGVSDKEIANAIENLNYEPHRMEVIKTETGVTIIDDSYNCNVEGARCAIETLAMFSGKRVVVSQGVVEMGKDEEKANYNIGMMLAAGCDILFAVGARGKDIARGMLDAGANPTKVIYVKNLIEAQKQFSSVLKRGDVLLLMNDLPDNY